MLTLLSLYMHEKVNTYIRQFRKTVLLGCIHKWQQIHLHNDCSIRVYQSFVAIFKIFPIMLDIMLNAFSDLLCTKLCWHNQLVPR